MGGISLSVECGSAAVLRPASTKAPVGTVFLIVRRLQQAGVVRLWRSKPHWESVKAQPLIAMTPTGGGKDRGDSAEQMFATVIVLRRSKDGF